MVLNKRLAGRQAFLFGMLWKGNICFEGKHHVVFMVLLSETTIVCLLTKVEVCANVWIAVEVVGNACT